MGQNTLFQSLRKNSLEHPFITITVLDEYPGASSTEFQADMALSKLF